MSTMTDGQRRIMAAAAILLILFSAGCLSFTAAEEPEVSLSTDKDVYSSGDHMLVQVTVNTSQQMNNVTIQGEGLITNKGPQIMLRAKTMNLSSGTNIVNFSKRVPSCSPCSGLNEGSYNITASVSQDGDLIAEVSCTVQISK